MINNFAPLTRHQPYANKVQQQQGQQGSQQQQAYSQQGQQQQHAPIPQQQMSYAAAAGGSTLVRHIRVPAWAVDQVGVHSAPLLPGDISDVVKDDPSCVFAVRLRDSFADLGALVRGERGYVLAALRQCLKAYVVPCACKDPALFICGFSSAPSIEPQVTFLSVKVSPMVVLPQSLQPQEEFLIVQSLSTEAATHEHLSEAVECSYKNFRILPYEAARRSKIVPSILKAMRSGIAAVIPRKAIITSDFAEKMLMLKINPSSEPTPVAKAIAQYCAGNFIQGKGCVRAVFEKPITRELFDTITAQFGDVCKEISSDDGKFKWTPPKEKTMIIIRRFDGCPITETTKQTIVLGLSLEKASLKNGALFGRIKNPQQVHDSFIDCHGITLSIVWLAAGDHASTSGVPDDPNKV